MDTDGPSVTSSCPQAVPMNTQEHPLTTQRMAALGRGNSRGVPALHEGDARVPGSTGQLQGRGLLDGQSGRK